MQRDAKWLKLLKYKKEKGIPLSEPEEKKHAELLGREQTVQKSAQKNARKNAFNKRSHSKK